MPGGETGWATRIAGMLRGLAHALERWALRLSPPRPMASNAALAARFPGAPEHWLAYIAERAPHLAAAASQTRVGRPAPALAPPAASPDVTRTAPAGASAPRRSPLRLAARQPAAVDETPGEPIERPAAPAQARPSAAGRSAPATAHPRLTLVRPRPPIERPPDLAPPARRAIWPSPSAETSAPASDAGRLEAPPPAPAVAGPSGRAQPAPRRTDPPAPPAPGAWIESPPALAIAAAPGRVRAFDSAAPAPPPRVAAAAPAAYAPAARPERGRTPWPAAPHSDARAAPMFAPYAAAPAVSGGGPGWRDARDADIRWPAFPPPRPAGVARAPVGPTDLARLRLEQDVGLWSA